MPKYDYKCDGCHYVYTDMEHPMEETLDWTECPTRPVCDGFLHKVFRPTAVSFKGQGWGKVYRTYKPKG